MAMNIPSTSNAPPIVASATQSAVEGIRTQEELLERNVTEVARSESAESHDTSSRDRALTEQNEIVQAVQANARSLEAANERIGTLVDLEA